MNMTNDPKWYRLDNTANLFPVNSTPTYSNVYRISAYVKDDVEPKELQQALADTLPLFSSFRVRLRHGLFWYYLENNPLICPIYEEPSTPCTYIETAQNNHFLFRVMYYKNRISIETFHVICDGSASINFLKEIVCRYLTLIAESKSAGGPTQEAAAYIPSSVDVPSNPEDSYKKYCANCKPQSYSTQRAYSLKGLKLPLYAKGVIHGILSARKMIDYCHAHNTTVTQYLAASMLWCIYEEDFHHQAGKLPVNLSIPVNLRPYFQSTTTMNFFSQFMAGMTFDSSDITYADVEKAVKEQFEKELVKERFSEKIAYNTSFENRWYVRIFPLPLKNLCLKISFLRAARANTMTLTNLGKITVPDAFRNDIQGFEILMNTTDNAPLKCTVCTYGDDMRITFISRLRQPYLQQAFFKKLIADGFDVSINTNGVFYE